MQEDRRQWGGVALGACYNPAMRDVSRKIDTLRTATARSVVQIGPSGMEHLRAGTLPKGDPFGVCQAAGMLAAKKTAELIPHCHNLPLDMLEIQCQLTDTGVEITAQARTVWKTGVEMEALTAVSVAALTLYDLLKPVEEQVVIADTRLLEKRGGSSQFAQFFRDTHPRFAVLVASDRASDGTYQDQSGAKIQELVSAHGGQCVAVQVLPDDQASLTHQLQEWIAGGQADFIFTTGGTGIAPRDVMVEASRAVIEREVPGIAEAMRGYSQRRKPLAMFTRGMVGVAGRTMIINLPGSPKGVEECLETLLPFVFHALSELAKSPAAQPSMATPAGTPAVVPMGAQPMATPAPAPAVAAPPPAPTPAPMPTANIEAPMDQTPSDQPHLNPGWRGTVWTPSVTPEPLPSVPQFDPVTGAPIGYQPADAPPPVESTPEQPLGGAYAQGTEAPLPTVPDDATPPAIPSVLPVTEAPKEDTNFFQMPPAQ